MLNCKYALKILFWLGMLAVLPAQAEERISEYRSEIRIQADGSLLITEDITANTEGKQIRRGIFRDFPTAYRDRFGNRRRVGFEILDVMRDGQPEPWHSENQSNGERIYIGSASHLLTEGEYTWTIRYRTTRQLGFFDGYDELYWNVTGQGWFFPIEQVNATIHFPQAVDPDQLLVASYTGIQGAKGTPADFEVLGADRVRFTSTRPLQPNEGMTVAVGFSKGMVAVPSLAQEIAWFFSDNSGTLALALGLLVLLAWYGYWWDQKGRDPIPGVIIPLYGPPNGLSPAACSQILKMGFSPKACTAALISLGVKGHLKIEDNDGDFKLQRLGNPEAQALSPGEQVVLDTLLPGSTDSIELDNKHHRLFSRALGALKQTLEYEYKNRLYHLNRIYVLPAVILSIVSMIVAAITGNAGPLMWVLFVVGSLTAHIVFVILLKAPTPAGRKIMDQIEGFRMFLETSERDRLALMESPELTPHLFEMFLPYAFALGVENYWCKRFAAAYPELHEGGKSWQPGWYHGDVRGAQAMQRIGSDLSSGMSSAISSASSPPGSSSGSGGGGSSGGGGGGGGGGGW